MKKSIILIVSFSASILLFNCRKNYDCECTYKVSQQKDAVESWQSTGMGNVGKKQLENRCKNEVSNDTMSCVLVQK